MSKAGNYRPLVLLVEDVDWIRSGMRRHIEAEGFIVLEAGNDCDAFELAERTRPDLVVTEEEVPTMAALSKRLREHPTLSSVPVAIINPDAEEGGCHEGARVLSTFRQLHDLLPHPARRSKDEHGGA